MRDGMISAPGYNLRCKLFKRIDKNDALQNTAIPRLFYAKEIKHEFFRDQFGAVIHRNSTERVFETFSDLNFETNDKIEVNGDLIKITKIALTSLNPNDVSRRTARKVTIWTA